MNDGSSVYLLFGFSAAGKTTLGEHLAKILGYHWVELDIPGLKTQRALNQLDTALGLAWRNFRDKCDASDLRDGLLAHASQYDCQGVVAGFQSDVILTLGQCRCLQEARVKCVILVGDTTRLLQSFLAREQQSGRNLLESHWREHNRGQIESMRGRACCEFEVDVFDHTGARRLLTDLTAEIVNHHVTIGRGPLDSLLG